MYYVCNIYQWTNSPWVQSVNIPLTCKIRLNMNTSYYSAFTGILTFANVYVMREQEWTAPCTVGFLTAMGHLLFTEGHFIFTLKEMQKSLWTLFFLTRTCHFPHSRHLTLFNYTRLSYLLFHHWHPTSMERRAPSLDVGLQ